jgi:hypothetical protein
MTSLVSVSVDNGMRIAPPDHAQGSSNRSRSRQGGRRIVNPETGGNGNTGGGGGGGAGAGAEKQIKHVDISDIDDLQRILDQDADAILNMKRDISNAQQTEVRRAQGTLLKSQKEFDARKIENKRKTAHLADLLDKEKELARLQGIRSAQGSASQCSVQVLQSGSEVIEERLCADRRSLGVMALMHARVQAETEALRAESQVVSQQLELKKTELLGLTSTRHISKQELLEEQHRNDDLVKMVKSRAQQRVAKMGQLQSLLALNGSLEDSNTMVDTKVLYHTILYHAIPYYRYLI